MVVEVAASAQQHKPFANCKSLKPKFNSLDEFGVTVMISCGLFVTSNVDDDESYKRI
jgi:hypothetical protein